MTDIENRIAKLEREKAQLVLEVHNKNKRIAELKIEVDRAVENRDYWKEQTMALKAKDVDKPWQWMVDWVFENAPHEVFDELMSSKEEYIKSMME